MGDRYKQAKLRAARYCSFAERSPRQVLEKLEKYGLDRTQAELALHELKNENFVDEGRFCRAFCHDKFEFNGWGRKKIEIELYHHQLSSDAIEEGLDYIDGQKYTEKIIEQLKTKWNSLKEEDSFLAKKKKTTDFLIRKGFEPGLVFALFEEHLSAR